MISTTSNSIIEPRSLDRGRRDLRLVAVDDRQSLFGEGITLAAPADFMMALGAHHVMNPEDDGSSTRLVDGERREARILNLTIDNFIRGRERPAMANHLRISVRQ